MHTAPSSSRALLGIIGGGNMAKAIILGAIEAKLLGAFEIAVCEPDAAKRKMFASWNVKAFDKIPDMLAALAPQPPVGVEWPGVRSGQVLLAVKPQNLPEVGRELAAAITPLPRPPVIISILAGTPIDKLRAALGAGDAEIPVIRVMPNTPARLRRAMTAMSVAPGVTPEQAQFTYDLFTSLGEVVKIDESLMDAFTALSGSGPAYLFYLAEAMLAAAAEIGFDRITADRIVRQTLTGAAALLGDSSEPPATLRAAVTSKGGTTEAACEVLDNERVREAFVAAIIAGRDRGREIAQGA